MLRASVSRLTVGLVLCAGIGACMLGPKLRKEAELVEKKISTARERGAYRCAPKELATAEANLEFLRYELDMGEFRRARRHHRAAMTNINQAIENTDPNVCAPKQVLIAEEKKDVVIEKTDTDEDGILDDVDQCPDEPEDKDEFEDENGCPDPDNDADTVLDTDDQCPNEPGDPENDGCPVLDRDGDGIADDADECPDVPEDLDGNEDEDGCPEEENVDSDGDGLLDQEDECPQEPEDTDGFEDEDGCPDPDNDQDTVLDRVDACPMQPGSPANTGCPVTDRDGDGVTDDVDNCPDVPGSPPNGCPKKVLVVKTEKKIEIKKKINFQTGKAKIRGGESFEILDQVAAVLKSNPDIEIVIEGHTDSRGGSTYNLKLSDARANSVRAALIERGIAPERMEAVGYGESKPIASNRTRQGRATNRRVEFRIVQDEGEQ